MPHTQVCPNSGLTLVLSGVAIGVEVEKQRPGRGHSTPSRQGHHTQCLGNLGRLWSTCVCYYDHKPELCSAWKRLVPQLFENPLVLGDE